MTGEKLSERLLAWENQCLKDGDYTMANNIKEERLISEVLEAELTIVKARNLEYEEQARQMIAENQRLQKQILENEATPITLETAEILTENQRLNEQNQRLKEQSNLETARANLNWAHYEQAMTDYRIAETQLIKCKEGWSTLKARLSEAEKVMVNYHCENFMNFPDEARCGTPKRPCKSYFLCEGMNKSLGVDKT